MNDEPTLDGALEEDWSPGDLLAQGRERCGLSEEEVAERLNLSVNQIRALEGNRFSELPGKTYVLGYLKAYTRLVGCDEREVLRNFNLQEDATIRGIKPVVRPTHRGGKRKKLLSVLILLVLGGVGFIWWQNSERSNAVPPQTGFVPQGDGLIVQRPDQVELSVETRTLDPSTDPESSQDAAGDGAAQPENELRAMIEAEEQSRSATGTEAASSEPESAPVSGAHKVELEFTAGSWVDIRDADGKRLLYEDVNQGRQISVEGRPPISVFLGNAKGVIIKYNGKPFDFSKFTNGIYARFNLGASAQ